MSFSFSRLGDLARKLLGFRYLVVGSSLLFFAILGIALYLVYKNSRVMQDQITADFNQQQLILAYQAASQINALIGDLEIEIKSLMALQDRTPEGVSRETMQAMMERTRGKGLLEIGLMDHSGRVIRFYDLRGGRRISPERLKDYGRLEASGGMKLNRLQAETSASGETLVTSKFCLPITLGGGEMGKLFARLDVSRLVARVTSEIRSGRTGYAWVIDQSGLFLYHPEKDFVGKNAFTARAERQPYISFAQINRIMKERMLRGEEGVGIYESGWHRGMEGKITKLIAFTPVRSSAREDCGRWRWPRPSARFPRRSGRSTPGISPRKPSSLRVCSFSGSWWSSTRAESPKRSKRASSGPRRTSMRPSGSINGSWSRRPT
jgi:two-component system NtrC family sensor kinase